LKAVLFDLDGTLLPIDTLAFSNDYVQALSVYLKDIIPPRKTIEYVLQGTMHMIMTNAEPLTNKELFEQEMFRLTGIPWEKIDGYAQRFYDEGLDPLLEGITPDPRAKRAVELARAKSHICVLATNPIFPEKPVNKRIHVAGLHPDDFDFITTYENCCFAKPHLAYYNYIAEKVGVKPEDCLMIGNDAQDDLVARKLGMKVFWATDHAIDSQEGAWHEPLYDAKGSFDEIIRFLENF